MSVPFMKGVGESNPQTIIGQCQQSLLTCRLNIHKSTSPYNVYCTLIHNKKHIQ